MINELITCFNEFLYKVFIQVCIINNNYNSINNKAPKKNSKNNFPGFIKLKKFFF